MTRKSAARPAKKPVRAVRVKKAAAKPIVTGTSEPRMDIAERVTTAIERELDVIEQIVSSRHGKKTVSTEAERRVRMLASLSRTLTALKKLQEGDAQRSAGDDDRPRDLDELRERLSQRLARKFGDRAPVHAGGDDARRDQLPE